MNHIEIYEELLKIKPWFQRTGLAEQHKAKVFKTHRTVILKSVDGGAVWYEPTVMGGSTPDNKSSDKKNVITVLDVFST